MPILFKFGRSSFPHFHQIDEMSCGPTCLRIIASHFGRTIRRSEAEALTFKGKQGISMLSLCDAAEALGMRTLPAYCSYEKLVESRNFPFIAHWRQNHFLVVYGIERGRVLVSDPAAPGLASYSEAEFRRYWLSGGDDVGIAIFFETTPEFYTQASGEEEASVKIFSLLAGYLRGHGPLVRQILTGLFIGNILTLAIPLLAMALVDEGVNSSDLSFVETIVIAQICVLVGIAIVELIRGWLTLHFSARINIAIVSDFLAALLRLPIAYFDSRTNGDILQRLDDHKRIERLIVSNAPATILSLFGVAMYAVVLAIYSVPITMVFLAGTAGQIIWVVGFLKRRKLLDYKRFNELARNRATEVQLIQNMPEIKLTGSEKQKRWDWERIQVRIFRINAKALRIEQLQSTGATFIQNVTIVLASYLAAQGAITGEVTLGTMVAVALIMGQVSVPLAQLVDVVRQAQDATLSFERITEVRQAAPEESPHRNAPFRSQAPLTFHNVSFGYGDLANGLVLDGIGFDIPAGKTTAIVGRSGSGKTTLLKLLLKFYDPVSGKITIGDTPLSQCSAHAWRAQCGVVMQDGHIFTDTIARNIAITDEYIDSERLYWAAGIANALSFIESLPLGLHTRVGEDGVGLSAGQKQRLLIARAIYRKPSLLILDEATSALDTENEAAITSSMAKALRDTTIVAVAHRLSTVRDADQIIVLEGGKIVEIDNHDRLVAGRGLYFDLVRNQLELGA